MINEFLKSRPFDGPKIISANCGFYHTILLSDRGEVFSFGANGFGQLGREINIYTSEQSTQRSARLLKVMQGIRIIFSSCGPARTILVSDQGEVFSFGSENDKLGRKGYHEPLKIISVYCGAYHTILLTNGGEVHSFGSNNCGQLGRETIYNEFLIDYSAASEGIQAIKEIDRKTPMPINSLKEIKIISAGCGDHHTILLSDKGEVYSFGSNEYGQLGRDTNKQALLVEHSEIVEGDGHDIPMLINSLKETKIIHVVCGEDYTILLSDKGEVYSFGANTYGQLGRDGDTKIPMIIESLKDQKIISASCGYCHTILLNDKGEVFSFGANQYDQLGRTGDNKAPMKIPNINLFQ